MYLKIDFVQEIKFYLEKFQNVEPKAIVLCMARGLTPKEHSPSPVLLATDLLVKRIVWRALQGGE